MELIALIKVVEIGQPRCTTLYLRIPAALRRKLGVTNEDLFFCYFNNDSKAITYVPRSKGEEV